MKKTCAITSKLASFRHTGTQKAANVDNDTLSHEIEVIKCLRKSIFFLYLCNMMSVEVKTTFKPTREAPSA